MAEANELTIAMRLRGARAVNSQLNETAASVNRVNAAAKKGVAPITAWGKSMSRTGAVLTRRLSLPIAVASGYAVKLAVDFDTSMRKIIGLVGVSRKQVEAWKGDIRDISRDTTIGTEALADALFFITSAGFRGKAAIRVLLASARASAAGLGDTKTVADAVTSAVNAYGEKTLKAAKATDILVAGVREGKMPVEDLAGSIGQVLGVASEVGVSFSEVTATAAALSRVGAPVHRTMTGIRFLLANLFNPASKAEKVLKKIGLTSDDVRKSIKEKGLLATLQLLKGQLPIQDFLKVVGGARGVVVALGLVGKHADVARKILDKVRGSTGATDKAFDAMAEGPGFRLRKAINNLKVSLEEFGDAITPIVVGLATAIGGLTEGLTSMGRAGKIILTGLALLGPALMLTGFALKVFAARGALAAGMEFGLAAETWGLTAALLACPVTWIVLGLAAIGIGFFLLYTKVKAFREAVQATWSWIRSHWRLLAVIIGGPLLGGAIVLLINHFKTLRSWAEKVVHMVERIVRAIGRIHFPHVPGSGFFGKVAHGLGSAANVGERVLGGKAAGGPISASGPYLVGEKGPEIVRLPAGAHVTPNSQMSGGELVTVPVQLQLDGRVIAETTARVVADRKARR